MPVFDELMYSITEDDYNPISTEKDLQSFLLKTTMRNFHGDYVTSWASYTWHLSQGHRPGQAFMNALPDNLYDKLTGTRIDPFYKSDMNSVLKALDYLILS